MCFVRGHLGPPGAILGPSWGHLVGQRNKYKNVECPLEKCVKVEKQVIWHYVLRRDLEVLNAPALRRLSFRGHEAAALQREGPPSANYTFLPRFFGHFWGTKGAKRVTTTQGHRLAPQVFAGKYFL